MSVEGEFFLSVTGSIDFADFYDVGNAYCKYGYYIGPEWSVVAVSNWNVVFSLEIFWFFVLVCLFFYVLSLIQLVPINVYFRF